MCIFLITHPKHNCKNFIFLLIHSWFIHGKVFFAICQPNHRCSLSSYEFYGSSKNYQANCSVLWWEQSNTPLSHKIMLIGVTLHIWQFKSSFPTFLGSISRLQFFEQLSSSDLAVLRVSQLFVVSYLGTLVVSFEVFAVGYSVTTFYIHTPMIIRSV